MQLHRESGLEIPLVVASWLESHALGMLGLQDHIQAHI
jgi:hypothetical protein